MNKYSCRLWRFSQWDRKWGLDGAKDIDLELYTQVISATVWIMILYVRSAPWEGDVYQKKQRTRGLALGWRDNLGTVKRIAVFKRNRKGYSGNQKFGINTKRTLPLLLHRSFCSSFTLNLVLGSQLFLRYSVFLDESIPLHNFICHPCDYVLIQP